MDREFEFIFIARGALIWKRDMLPSPFCFELGVGHIELEGRFNIAHISDLHYTSSQNVVTISESSSEEEEEAERV